MAEPLPQLPADFFDKAPPSELPHDFFEKNVGSTSEAPKGPQRTSKLKLKPRERKEGDWESEAEKFQSEGGFSSIPFFSRAQAGMKGLKEGKPADFLGNLAGAGAELIRPEAETIATIESGKGVYGAGKALLKGSAKPAIGLAAGIGTGYVVDKATRALGLPGWLPEILGGLAGAKVGGKIGMSPEAVEAFESGGAKGLLNRLLKGSTTDNEAFEFYKETHGQAPKTGAEKLAARAEATAYKKKIAKQLEPIVANSEDKYPPTKQLAHEFYEENHGAPPKGAQQKIQAVKELKKAMRVKKARTEGATETPSAEAKADPNDYRGSGKPLPSEPPANLLQGPLRKGHPAAEARADEVIANNTKEPLNARIREGKNYPLHTDLADARPHAADIVNTQATAKNETMAKYFADKKITPSQIMEMSEAELNMHLEQNGYKPFLGKGLSRSVAQGKSDLIKALNALGIK